MAKLLDLEPSELERVVTVLVEDTREKRIHNVYLGKDVSDIEENQKVVINSLQFNNFLRKNNIRTLDDLNIMNVSVALGTWVGGFNHGQTIEARKRFVELDILSPDIETYDLQIQDKLFERAVNSISNNNMFWSYASPRVIEDTIIRERNIKALSSSEQFKEYLVDNQILTLNDIITSNISRFVSLLGEFKSGQVIKARKRFVELDILSPDIGSYNEEAQERAFRQAIDSISGGKRAWTYVSDQIIGEEEVIENNRRLFAKSKQLKTYLTTNGIMTLRDVNKASIGGLGTLLGGFSKNKTNLARKRFMELKALSPDIQDYDPLVQEREFEQVLRDLPNGSSTWGYVNETFVENKETIEKNRRAIVESEQFRKYLVDGEIFTLNDLSSKNVSMGIGTLLGGFSGGQVIKARQRFVELEIFDTNLENLVNLLEEGDQLEESKEDYALVDRILDEFLVTGRSAYFDDAIVGEESVKSNQNYFLSSEYVQSQLSDRNIDLLNPSNNTERRISRALNLSKLENRVSQTRSSALSRNKKSSYHVIRSEWSKSDEIYLRNIALNEVGEPLSQEDFLEKLKQNSKTYENDLSRNFYAIQLKMQEIGLISERISFSNNYGDKPTNYSFPKITQNALKEDGVIFSNYAASLFEGNTPEVIPCYGYPSSVSFENGNPQFLHVTTPIFYRGVDLENYHETERRVMESVGSYMQEAGSGNASILEVRDKNLGYVQLLGRLKGNFSTTNFDTSALGLVDLVGKLEDSEDSKYANSEIYLFCHEHKDITYGNTRR